MLAFVFCLCITSVQAACPGDPNYWQKAVQELDAKRGTAAPTIPQPKPTPKPEYKYPTYSLPPITTNRSSSSKIRSNEASVYTTQDRKTYKVNGNG